MTTETVSETPLAPRPSPTARILIIVGGLLVAAGVCAAGVFLVVPFLARPDALAANTAVLSIAAILSVYGALLVLIGRALRNNRWRAPFQLPSPYLLLGAYFLVLIIGQGVLFAGIMPALLFPIWHVLASLLFPLAVLAFAAPRLEAVSIRSVLAQFTWGGLVTISVALILELVIGGGLALLALLGIAVVLGQDAVAEIAKAFTQVPTDTGRIIEIVFQQPLSVAIAGGAAFLMIVILVPLVEELLKSAGVAIALARRRRANFLPARGNAVLWGLAAGAGYAFSENMLNGQGTLNDPNSLTGFWAGAMTLRAGTSLMHMITTATVAAGWYEALVARRPIRFPLLLLAAVLAHAIWNTSALLLAGVSTTRTADTPLASLSTVLSILALGLLAFLFVGCVFWLRALLHWARRSPNSIPA